jgi:hypothetical protein
MFSVDMLVLIGASQKVAGLESKGSAQKFVGARPIPHRQALRHLVTLHLIEESEIQGNIAQMLN